MEDMALRQAIDAFQIWRHQDLAVNDSILHVRRVFCQGIHDPVGELLPLVIPGCVFESVGTVATKYTQDMLARRSQSRINPCR